MKEFLKLTEIKERYEDMKLALDVVNNDIDLCFDEFEFELGLKTTILDSLDRLKDKFDKEKKLLVKKGYGEQLRKLGLL